MDEKKDGSALKLTPETKVAPDIRKVVRLLVRVQIASVTSLVVHFFVIMELRSDDKAQIDSQFNHRTRYSYSCIVELQSFTGVNIT